MSVLSPSELRDLRERLGLSQSNLATWLGYSLRTVQRWENGDTVPKPATVLFLRQVIRGPASRDTGQPKPPAFTFIDLFAGIGGMRIGFERHGGRCVYTCEWDRFCRQTYTANFPTSHEIAGDIRDVGTPDIPSHDLLLAGFPCQPFSVAGVSKKNSLGRPHGFADETQGTLFFDIARILRDHRPAAFLLENVKHLRSHDRGRTMDVILRTLEDELGYTVTTRVIDAKLFLPTAPGEGLYRRFQGGDRLFSGGSRTPPIRRAGPKLESVLHPEDGSEEMEPPYTEGDLAAVSDKYTLSDHLWAYLQEYARKHRLRGNGFGFGLVGPADTARTLSARYYKDGSEILIRQDRANPRRLTPRECARLMGFDGPGQNDFEIPVSDTQAYKQFGNAVAVPVVSAVAAAMAPHVVSLASDTDQLELLPRLRTA